MEIPSQPGAFLFQRSLLLDALASLDLLLELARALLHLPVQHPDPPQGQEQHRRQTPRQAQQPPRRPPGRPFQHGDVRRRVEHQIEILNVLTGGPISPFAQIDSRQRQPAANRNRSHASQVRIQPRRVHMRPGPQLQHLVSGLAAHIQQERFHAHQRGVVRAAQQIGSCQHRRFRQLLPPLLPDHRLPQGRRGTAQVQNADHVHQRARRQRHIFLGEEAQTVRAVHQAVATVVGVNDLAGDLHPLEGAGLEIERAQRRHPLER